MDITDHQDLGLENAFRAATKKHKTVVFPQKPEFRKDVRPLLEKLEKENMRANLVKFTSFHTRYYKVLNPIGSFFFVGGVDVANRATTADSPSSGCWTILGKPRTGSRSWS